MDEALASLWIGRSGGVQWPDALQPGVGRGSTALSRTAGSKAGCCAPDASHWLPNQQLPELRWTAPHELLKSANAHKEVKQDLKWARGHLRSPSVPTGLLRELLEEVHSPSFCSGELALNGNCLAAWALPPPSAPPGPIPASAPPERAGAGNLSEGRVLVCRRTGRGNEELELTLLATREGAELEFIESRTTPCAAMPIHQLEPNCGRVDEAGLAATGSHSGAQAVPALLAVRCTYWTIVMKLECSADGWTLSPVGALQTAARQLHLAWGRLLPHELAIACEDGSVVLASAAAESLGPSVEFFGVSNPLPKLQAHIVVPARPTEVPPKVGGRFVCAFGQHPRQLLLTSGNKLLQCDVRIRGPPQPLRVVCQRPDKDCFWALATPDQGPANMLAASTTQAVLLLDLRRPSSPQLIWRHGMSPEPPQLLSLHIPPPPQVPSATAGHRSTDPSATGAGPATTAGHRWADPSAAAGRTPATGRHRYAPGTSGRSVFESLPRGALSRKPREGRAELTQRSLFGMGTQLDSGGMLTQTQTQAGGELGAGTQGTQQASWDPGIGLGTSQVAFGTGVGATQASQVPDSASDMAGAQREPGRAPEEEDGSVEGCIVAACLGSGAALTFPFRIAELGPAIALLDSTPKPGTSVKRRDGSYGPATVHYGGAGGLDKPPDAAAQLRFKWQPRFSGQPQALGLPRRVCRPLRGSPADMLPAHFPDVPYEAEDDVKDWPDLTGLRLVEGAVPFGRDDGDPGRADGCKLLRANFLADVILNPCDLLPSPAAPDPTKPPPSTTSLGLRHPPPPHGPTQTLRVLPKALGPLLPQLPPPDRPPPRPLPPKQSKTLKGTDRFSFELHYKVLAAALAQPQQGVAQESANADQAGPSGSEAMDMDSELPADGASNESAWGLPAIAAAMSQASLDDDSAGDGGWVLGGRQVAADEGRLQTLLQGIQVPVTLWEIGQALKQPAPAAQGHARNTPASRKRGRPKFNAGGIGTAGTAAGAAAAFGRGEPALLSVAAEASRARKEQWQKDDSRRLVEAYREVQKNEEGRAPGSSPDAKTCAPTPPKPSIKELISAIAARAEAAQETPLEAPPVHELTLAGAIGGAPTASAVATETEAAAKVTRTRSSAASLAARRPADPAGRTGSQQSGVPMITLRSPQLLLGNLPGDFFPEAEKTGMPGPPKPEGRQGAAHGALEAIEEEGAEDMDVEGAGDDVAADRWQGTGGAAAAFASQETVGPRERMGNRRDGSGAAFGGERLRDQLPALLDTDERGWDWAAVVWREEEHRSVTGAPLDPQLRRPLTSFPPPSSAAAEPPPSHVLSALKRFEDEWLSREGRRRLGSESSQPPLTGQAQGRAVPRSVPGAGAADAVGAAAVGGGAVGSAPRGPAAAGEARGVREVPASQTAAKGTPPGSVPFPGSQAPGTTQRTKPRRVILRPSQQEGF